jgi:hypothetical protein
MSINNSYSLHEIVKDVLKETITNPRQWNFDQFIEIDVWKSDKDNKYIQRFIKQMRKKYENKILDPGEWFSYVVTHPKSIFDLSGIMLKQPKADRMEFVDVAKEYSRNIDLSHYFENTINRLCTQFIMYDKKYKPLSTDKIIQISDLDEKYKQIDSYIQNKTKK